jgi:hypothetical protein
MTFVGRPTVYQAFGLARFHVLVAETRGDAQPVVMSIILENDGHLFFKQFGF